MDPIANAGAGIRLGSDMTFRMEGGATLKPSGLAVSPSIANRGKAFVTGIVVDDNTASGNGLHEGSAGIGCNNTSSHEDTGGSGRWPKVTPQARRPESTTTPHNP